MSMDKSSRNWTLSQMTSIVQAIGQRIEHWSWSASSQEGWGGGISMICTVMEAWKGGLSHSQVLHSWCETPAFPAAAWYMVFVLKTPSSPMRPETWEADNSWRLAPWAEEATAESPWFILHRSLLSRSCSAASLWQFLPAGIYSMKCIQPTAITNVTNGAAHYSSRPISSPCSSLISRVACWTSILGYPCPLCGHIMYLSWN